MVRGFVLAMGCGLTLTAGCVPTPPAPTVACNADESRGLLGQNITVLQTMRFGVTLRIIGPGTLATMELNPDRLNIIHDKTGLITDIGCY